MFGLMKFVSKYKENFLLASGHFATDICQGSVSAALAVMFAHNVLSSNIEVSYLVLASCLVSSIIQPIIGWLSDRKPRPYLMALGMFVAAFGLMFIGFHEFWGFSHTSRQLWRHLKRQEIIACPKSPILRK